MGIRFTDKSIKPILDVQESNSYDNTIAYEVNASSFDTTYISNRVLSYYIISIQGYGTGEIEPLGCSVPITVNLYKIINNTQILYSSIKDEINYTREYKYVFIDKIFKESFTSSSFSFSFKIEVICEEDITLTKPEEIVIEGELYNLLKEISSHEIISNDYKKLGKVNYDLFTLDLYNNLFNIATSSILPLSIGATYCYGSNGLFGRNIRCNYEYKIILEADYLELIDCINNSTYFQKVNIEEARKYDIIVEDDSEIYVNLNNYSYLLKKTHPQTERIDINYYMVNNTRYEMLVIGTGYHIELDLLLNRIHTDKGLITLNWIGSTLRGITSDNENIRISYSNYSYVTRIDYDKKRYLTFDYITRDNKKYLSCIKFCDNLNPQETETVFDTIYYNYNTDNRLSLIYDELSLQGISFDYNNGKLSRVKTILHNTNEYSSKIDFIKQNNITKIIDELGRETSYYFDTFGKCIMIIDDKGNMVSKQYQNNNNLASTPFITFNSKGIINTLDVIKNPCFINFDDENFEWIVTNAEATLEKSIGVNGRSALRVENNSSNFITLTQNITALDKIKGKKIKFFGYIRGSGVVTINLKVDNTNNEATFNARNVYDKIETPLVLIPDNVSSVTAIIKINGSSDIRLSEFNIESNISSHINHLENGDLDIYTSNSIKYWNIDNEGSEYGILNHFNIIPASIETPLNLLIDKEIKLFNCNYNIHRFKQIVDISGGSGEQITFTFFSKLNITNNECAYAKIKVHYKTLGYKEYQNNISDNTSSFKFNTFSIITESIYDSVEIGVYYKGLEDAYFSNFGLFKEDYGTYYFYNEKNSLIEIANGSLSAEIERNDNTQVKRYSDETGCFFEYKYLDNGNIESIIDNNGTNIKYEYDENDYLSKNTISIKNKRRMTLSQTNDINGNPLYIKNFDGSIQAFEYDDRERIKKQNHSNGLVEHFQYDNKDYLINKKYDFYTNLINHDFSYDTKYNLSNIDITNGSELEINHNSWSDLESLEIDNREVTSFSYINQGDYYTGLPQYKTYPNGQYEFRYDNLLRPSNIRFNNGELVNYEYDDNNNLVSEVEVSNTRNYKYDSNGKLININDNHVDVTYEYDNLENIEQKSIKLDYDYLNYNYIYDFEYNEYSIGGYFSRLERINNNDFLLDGINFKYSNNENIDYNRDLLFEDETLNKCIIRFTNPTDYIKYDLSSINNMRSKIISDKDSFDYEDWKKEFKNKKEIYFFIKVDSLVNNISTNILSFNIGNNKKVRLLFDYKGSLNIVFNNTFYDFSGLRMIKGEWNLVRIGIENVFDNNNQLIKNVLYIHLNIYQTSVNITGSIFDISTIDNIMLGGNSNVNNNEINHYDILYLSIGNTISSRVSLIGLYNDAYKYVFGDEVKKSKGVVYYNHNLYNDLDVIPLNGSLNSIKGLKPYLYTYTDSTYKLNKTKLFKLDKKISNIDNDYTNKHVYGSYDSISMDGESRSLLGYDFGFKNEGMIGFWFKMDSSNERLDGAIRTLISVPTGTSEGHKLLIYFNNIYNSLFVYYSGLSEPINTHLTVLSDKWHLFTFNFNNTNIKISIDEQVYNKNLIDPLDLSNKITYIGCNYGFSAPGGELNGSIEMLTYDNHYNENIHNTLLSAGSITHITCYDELNRINNKEIITRSNRLIHKYNYYDETINENNDTYININTLPCVETLEDGSIIYYTYDNSFNITHKVITKNNDILDNYFYKYDSLNRLIEEKNYTSNIFNYHKIYSYNEISDITEIIEYDVSNEPLRKSVYNYSNTIKSQLNNMTYYIYEGNDRWSIDYVDYFVFDSTDSFRPSTYKDNTLTWQGRRLTSFGDNSYTYNSEGIRTRKETLNGTYNYYLEGNKIIKETKPNNINVIYHYDESGMLVGFNYNNNEYFYSRDLTGNIIKIIDIDGSDVVEYKYDAYGKVLDIIGNENIKYINSYLYKGYYYDFETNLYYCNSRFYDPEVLRWISIDEISYLDSESASGINLWCYCNNNPVVYSDRLGYFGILIYLLDAIIETIILFTNEDYKADKVMNNNVVTIKNSSLFNNPLAQELYSRYLYNNIKNDDGTQYFTGNEYDIMAEWQWHNIVTWGTISVAIDGLLSAKPIELVVGVVVSVVAVKHTFTAEIGHSIEDENNRPIVYIPSKVIKWVLELLNKNK